MQTLDDYSEQYSIRKEALSNRAAEAVRQTLHPRWAAVLQRAKADGDLAERLREELTSLDDNLRQLAQSVLLSPTLGDRESVFAFLQADTDEEKMSWFCAFVDGLVSHPAPQEAETLTQLNDWLREWGEKYLTDTPDNKWQETDEAKIWQMLNLIQPWRNKDKKSWQPWLAFTLDFKSRIIHRVTRPHWREHNRPKSRVLLTKIVTELPGDALIELPVTDESAISLEEADKKESIEGWVAYIAQFSVLSWQNSIRTKDSRQRNSQGGLRTALLVTGVLALLVIIVTGVATKGFGLFLGEEEGPATPEITVTNQPGSEPNLEPTAEVPVPSARLTLLSEPAMWVCDGGGTVWQFVTIKNTGTEETTYSLNGDSESLINGQIWQDAPAEPTCESVGGGTKLSSVVLPAGEEKTLLVSYPNTTDQNYQLSIGANGENLASVELPPWESQLSAELTPVTDETTFFVKADTDTIVLSYTLSVNVPGTYQLICQPDIGEPKLSEPVMFSLGEVQESKAKSIVCETSGSGSNWQIAVASLSAIEGAETINVSLNEELQPVTLKLAQYGLEVSQVGEPIGITWGSNENQDNQPSDVGFVLTYMITNTGNVADAIYLEITNQEGFDTEPGQWDLIVTVIDATSYITGTFDQPLSEQNDIVLRLTESITITLPPIDPGVPNVDPKTYRLMLPEGQLLGPCINEQNCPNMYVAFWLNTFVKNSVNPENPVRFSFRLTPFSAPDNFVEEFAEINEGPKPNREITLRN